MANPQHVVGEAPTIYPSLAAARKAKKAADARLAAALKKKAKAK